MSAADFVTSSFICSVDLDGVAVVSVISSSKIGATVRPIFRFLVPPGVVGVVTSGDI